MRNWLQHWWNARRRLSAYLDMTLEAGEHARVWKHLQRCATCREEFEQLSELREDLRRIPVPAAPAGLAFEIRMRLAQERYCAQRPGWWWRLRNQLQPFAFPAVSGSIAALVIFALFIPSVAIPGAVYDNDVLLELRTPARLRGTGSAGLRAEPENLPENLMVQVLIDQRGRVADYSIVSGHYTPDDARQLRHRLAFTVFDPATFLGRPTHELRLLHFKSIRVRG